MWRRVVCGAAASTQQFSLFSMGPGLRRDDGFKANTLKTVIPAKAGIHNTYLAPFQCAATVFDDTAPTNFPSRTKHHNPADTARHPAQI